ncbi:ribonuclease HI [Paenibacillus alvei]|uniref:ribonuclease H family protein n=1 Tax=Paenibacillus alvei TaxID=44250 RepID=UPI00227FC50B|nr:ribonuclease H [Paenibacillus alvei]MCY9757672.1 ribonuclease HI [Paenibacillus alvei]
MTKEIHLWGDGSSVNNGEEKGLGGYGYTLLFGEFNGVDIKTEYGDKTKMLTGWDGFENTTNQKEEIKAIINGLKRIKANTNYPIQVFSDSAYLINCMNQRWYDNWRTNGWKNSKKEPVESPELWKELLQVIEDGFFKITWNKVKGHSGIFYNEQCDNLARQGLEKMRAIRRGED